MSDIEDTHRQIAFSTSIHSEDEYCTNNCHWMSMPKVPSFEGHNRSLREARRFELTRHAVACKLFREFFDDLTESGNPYTFRTKRLESCTAAEKLANTINGSSINTKK